MQISKCGLLSVSSKIRLLASLLVLSSVFSLLISQQANAWATAGEMPALSASLEEKLDQVFAGSRYADWRNQNWATGNYDGSTFLFVINDIAPVISDGGAGQTGLSGTICRWTTDLSWPGCNSLTNNQGIGTDTLYGFNLAPDFQTTWPTYYADLETHYPGLLDNEGSAGNDPDNNTTARCQPWDVACWFTTSIGNIVDGFQSLADSFNRTIQGLGEWLANLIMPANADGTFDNRFTTLFTDLSNGLTERLGFLLFPFQFLANVFQVVLNVWNVYGIGQNQHICTSAVGFSVPNLLGTEDVSINPCRISETPIWQPMQLLVRLAWVLGVVALLYNKYLSIVRGHGEEA